METKLSNHCCPTGIYVVPAYPMIADAATNNVSSSVLQWGLSMLGASIRIVLLSIVAFVFIFAISTMYAADYWSTRRSKAQRNVVRKNLQRPHTSVRRHTLELQSY